MKRQKPVVVAQHSPPLPVDGDYYGGWHGSNADELLDLLARHNILALVTGHWHINWEWLAKGVRVINTAALAGWLWNGTPPHYCIPAIPGYRLYYFDGKGLRSFWREGSYWSAPAPRREIGLYWEKPAPRLQVGLVRIDGAHTGGPRPQVRPVCAFGKASLDVTAYACETAVEKVEWRIAGKSWHSMKRTFDGIWSEWTGEIDLRKSGDCRENVCIVRATDSDGNTAFDVVPFWTVDDVRDRTAVKPLNRDDEMLFALFRCPE
jgi:hypothetical protein